MRILAIETSCDETAAAVVEKDGKDVRILSNVIASQIEIHRKFGGVFPEHASRAHCEKIIPVTVEALSEAHATQSKSRRRAAWSASRALRTDFHAGKIESGIFDVAAPSDIDFVAVTTGPGLIGSLLIGVNFAKTFAYSKNLPIIGINHWLGHIYSNWAEASDIPQFPALILIVSGGHTGLVLMKSHDEIIPLGQTLDDAAGEAFDKVAKVLDLGYPGGPAISKAAEEGNPKAFNFPRSMLDRKDFDFSFSGLKTAVLYESKKHKMTGKIKADMAASFQQAVIDILIGKTIQAAYQYRPKSICLCGGVSANKELRGQMKKAASSLPHSITFHCPPMALTTDNAAMIGIAAAYHLDKASTYDKINANANLKL